MTFEKKGVAKKRGAHSQAKRRRARESGEKR